MWDADLDLICQSYRADVEAMTDAEWANTIANFGALFTHHSQKMGGSALTEGDTLDFILGGIYPLGMPKDDIEVAQRHHNLFTEIMSPRGMPAPTFEAVQSWHARIFGQTMADAGRLRRDAVKSPPGRFAAVPEIRPRLAEMFERLASPDGEISPIMVACRAHYDLMSIRPFEDGNGRMARLLMNYLLIWQECPFLLIRSEHRKPYFMSLKRSNIKGNPSRFERWFAEYYVNDYNYYLYPGWV